MKTITKTTMSLAAAMGTLALAATSAHAATIIGELGILDDSANGGINPKTSAAWANGDTYRLFFVSSATLTDGNGSNDISAYHAMVQGAANATVTLGSASWFAVAQSSSDKDVTANAYNQGSTDVGIFMVNNALLANGTANLVAIAPNVTETGGTYNGNVATGHLGANNGNATLGIGAASTQTAIGYSDIPARWFVGGDYNGTPPGTTTSGTQHHLYAISEDLTVTVPVPEPSSAALLALGGLALNLRRRK